MARFPEFIPRNGGPLVRLRSTIWSTFLLFVLLAAVGHAAQFMELQVEPTKIVLELAKAEGQSYRVAHNQPHEGDCGFPHQYLGPCSGD